MPSPMTPPERPASEARERVQFLRAEYRSMSTEEWVSGAATYAVEDTPEGMTVTVGRTRFTIAVAAVRAAFAAEMRERLTKLVKPIDANTLPNRVGSLARERIACYNNAIRDALALLGAPGATTSEEGTDVQR